MASTGVEKRKWGFKHTAKQIASAVQKATTDRYIHRDTKAFRIDALARDVLALRKFVMENTNAEKKRYQFMPNTNALVGQVNINTSGHFIEDISPIMNQGTSEASRVGNSVKMSGTFGRIVFRNNATNGQSAPVRFRHYIISVKGDPYTNMSTLLADFLSPNRYLQSYNSVDIYDFNSERNPQNMSKFKVLRNKVIKCGGDTVTGMFQQCQSVIKLKYKNLHFKWENDLSSIPNNGQLVSIVLCDRGNLSSTGVSTLLGLTDIAINGGFAVDRYYTHYLVDN